MDFNLPDHLEEVPTPMIKLKSSDGEIFKVEVKVAQVSLHLRQMLDDLGVDENEVISIPQNAPKISGTILGKILLWARHHKDDPAVAEDDERKVAPMDDMSSWDAEFLQVDQSTLFQMIRAANYLLIKGLLDATCKKAAKMIQGMTVEGIRQRYNIQNDFSPEEEEQVRRENALCEATDSEGDHDGQKAPGDSIQNLDIEGLQAIEDCLHNSEMQIVKKIFQHFSDSQLLNKLSLVSKMWNFEARSVMRKRGNLIARVSCTGGDSCQKNVEAFLAAAHQMNLVPFSGINIHIHHMSCHHFPSQVLDSFHDVNLEQLELKKVSIDLFGECRNCLGFLLAKKVLHDFSGVLQDLSLTVHAKEQAEIEDVIQECRFPLLKVLKFNEDYSRKTDHNNKNLRELLSRAPQLQELHTEAEGPIWSVESVLEGSSAVIVHSPTVRAPFWYISETAIPLLRLKSLELRYDDPEFDFERFAQITPALLQASCTATLRSIRMDAVLAVPLMCYGVSLEKVQDLYMYINYGSMQRLQPEILGFLIQFNFTWIFPNLSKVKICGDYSVSSLNLDHMNRIIEQANVGLVAPPPPDRAVNVKGIHLDHCKFSDVNASFFAEMFPNIEKLKVEAAPEDVIPFGSIWKHWPDLEELEVVGRMMRNTGNLDSAFCGIFPAEAGELRLKDEEYLKRVHIVPVMPAITCLKNLRVLKLFRTGSSSEQYFGDGSFMFSKVTGRIAFAKNPALSVSLNFCFSGDIKATSHLKSFASVTNL